MMALAIWALSAVAFSPEPAPAGSSDEAVLLEMHREVLRDHMTADVEGWLAAESEDYVVAGRGEVTRPTKKERAEHLGPYLRRTKFKEYRDLIPPIVRVSKDGTLGWLICQITASGTQTSDAGREEPISFVSSPAVATAWGLWPASFRSERSWYSRSAAEMPEPGFR